MNTKYGIEKTYGYFYENDYKNAKNRLFSTKNEKRTKNRYSKIKYFQFFRSFLSNKWDFNTRFPRREARKNPLCYCSFATLQGKIWNPIEIYRLTHALNLAGSSP